MRDIRSKITIDELRNCFEPLQLNNSFLLSFEGIEGSGKSSQIQLLTQKLNKSNYEVHYFREPGGTDFGESLRSAILTSKSLISPTAEANLFAASRAQLLEQEVLPILKKNNQVVILDRFIDSSIAYQGIGRNLGVEKILDLHKLPPLNTTCHCTFYLKIDVETSLKRQAIRGNDKDYFEKENDIFYKQLIKGYDTAAKIFPERISIIDGSSKVEDVHSSILGQLKDKIGLRL